MRRKWIFIFFAFSLFFNILQTYAQNDSQAQTRPELRKGIITSFYELQRRGSIFINKQLKILRKGFDFKIFLIITFFSLVYGILHTLGPGHGKLIMASYFLQGNVVKSDALSLAVIISVIHSSTAIILAVMFKTVLISVKGLARMRIQNGFTLISGLIIITIGVVYLVKRIRKKEPPAAKQSYNAAASTDKRWLKNLVIGFSVGIVPCPLSLTIMMIAIAYNIFWVGIASVISLTLSMVFLLYIISIYTLKSRQKIETVNEKKHGALKPVTSILGYTGNALIIMIGLFLSYKGYIAFF